MKPYIDTEITDQVREQLLEGSSSSIENDNNIGSEKIMAVIREKEADGIITYVTDSDCNSPTENSVIYLSGSKEDIDFNYVWYSGKMWRVTAIYPDGSMKMITDNAMTSIAFGASDSETFNSNSYIWQWLNEDFYDTLNDYNASVIDTTKNWNIETQNSVTTKLSDSSTSVVSTNVAMVGLLNSYEYYLSYKKLGSSANGYLNTGYYWWLLNPYSSSAAWMVKPDGDALKIGASGSNGRGIRPVIYLKPGVTMTGNGTKYDPYIVNNDYEKASDGDLLNTRNNGEYLKFSDSNALYRIIEIDSSNSSTKIVAMDYALDGARKNSGVSETDTSFGVGTTSDTWDYYLNNDWYDSLSFKSILTTGTYYLGPVISNGQTPFCYKLSICSEYSPSTTTKNCNKTTHWTGYSEKSYAIGLLRYGEMFSTQQGSEMTPSLDMVLITRQAYEGSSTSSALLRVYKEGYNTMGGPNFPYSVRPTYNLSSEVTISSGSGTLNDPFVILNE